MKAKLYWRQALHVLRGRPIVFKIHLWGEGDVHISPYRSNEKIMFDSAWLEGRSPDSDGLIVHFEQEKSSR